MVAIIRRARDLATDLSRVRDVRVAIEVEPVVAPHRGRLRRRRADNQYIGTGPSIHASNPLTHNRAVLPTTRRIVA